MSEQKTAELDGDPKEGAFSKAYRTFDGFDSFEIAEQSSDPSVRSCDFFRNCNCYMGASDRNHIIKGVTVSHSPSAAFASLYKSIRRELHDCGIRGQDVSSKELILGILRSKTFDKCWKSDVSCQKWALKYRRNSRNDIEDGLKGYLFRLAIENATDTIVRNAIEAFEAELMRIVEENDVKVELASEDQACQENKFATTARKAEEKLSTFTANEELDLLYLKKTLKDKCMTDFASLSWSKILVPQLQHEFEGLQEIFESKGACIDDGPFDRDSLSRSLQVLEYFKLKNDFGQLRDKEKLNRKETKRMSRCRQFINEFEEQEGFRIRGADEFTLKSNSAAVVTTAKGGGRVEGKSLRDLDLLFPPLMQEAQHLWQEQALSKGTLENIRRAYEPDGPEGAEAMYQRALAVDPRNVGALADYGRFRESVRKGDFSVGSSSSDRGVR